MCGRVDFSWDVYDPAVRHLRAILTERFPGRAVPSGEVPPGTALPLLVAGGKKADVTFLSWGIPMSDGKLLLNARAETAAEKPMFRDALAARRCALLTTGFYEWNAEKKKFRFRLPDSPSLYLAGLYDREGRFVVLTTAANESMAEIHDRMPVVLPVGQVLPWLGGAEAAGFFSAPGPLLAREEAG
jgi:putative SOS response-associated peptidase YedK